MSSEQWQSLIRTVILGLPSIVGTSVMSSEQSNQLAQVLPPVIMAVATLVVGWWGVHSHSAPAVVAQVNSASVPGVKVVAESSPSPKVEITSSGEVKTV